MEVQLLFSFNGMDCMHCMVRFFACEKKYHF
jgi:hypothetical protein